MSDELEDEAIAVVGMACRVPGADDPQTLWRNLCAGISGIRRFTSEQDGRWVPAFGHLDALTDFDAGAFGYSAEEAALIDPQHRLFLEVARWALEPVDTAVAQVGVFAGSAANRYHRHHLLHNPAVLPPDSTVDDWDDLLQTGAPDYLPLRVAHTLGLRGPAIAVQTACSSSLVAVCQAAQSLLDFRCDVAVAGGAAVVSTRQDGYRWRQSYADDGVCRPYDAAATGQVFGNGAAAVVLKRLSDARADGDRVHAVLAGWAVNNDGADRAGFATPGISGQAAVVAEAMAAAGWASVGYVEGHGSGTPIGDAIEVEALARALRAVARRDVHCGLGSLKGNLGNLDAAAGVTGLIKTVYAVAEGVLPPTLHFGAFHPDVPAEAARLFTVNAECLPWTDPERRAGVSSFGLGGTNAHVLVAPGDAGPVQLPATRTEYRRTRCWIEAP